jgi:hypothetical protein
VLSNERTCPEPTTTTTTTTVEPTTTTTSTSTSTSTTTTTEAPTTTTTTTTEAPTTTTTTTNGGGGAPTAWIGYIAQNTFDSCNQINGSTKILYTSTSTIIIGTIFYVDAALTQVYNPSVEGGAFKVSTSSYVIAGFGSPQIGAVQSIFSCTPTTTTTTTTLGSVSYAITSGGYSDILSACENVFGMSSTVYGSSNPLGVTTFYTDPELTNIFTGSSTSNNFAFYITGSSTSYTAVIDEAGNVTGNALCPEPTTTTTTTTSGVSSQSAIGAFDANDACSGSGSATAITLYYTGSLGNGTALYSDAALTIGYDNQANGDYVRLYFQAQDQVCTMNGNIIQSYVACSSITTTTTTTTTVEPTTTTTSTSTSTTTTTTTAAPALSFIGRFANSGSEACLGNNETFYTTGPLQSGLYPQSGNIIYFDQALTQLVTYGYIASPGIGQVWEVFPSTGELYNQDPC